MCIAVALSAVCCAGASFCNCCCSCCKQICGVTFKQQIRLAYVILTLVCILISIFATYGAKEMFEWFNDIFGSNIGCPGDTDGEDGLSCYGVSSLYRMSFTLVFFFSLIISFLYTRGECAKSVNEGLWTAKIFCLIAFYIICFFIPNGFFKGYVLFSQIMSTIFLLVQSVILIDLFYLWGQSWAQKYHKGSQTWGYVLIGTFVFLYIGIIVFNIFLFIWFDTSLNITLNIINCILIAVVTTVQLLGFNKYGSILTTGSVSLYMTFMNFSAMMSSKNKDGDTIMSETGAYFLNLSIGISFIILIFFYLTFGSQQKNSNRIKTGEDAGVTNQLLLDENEQDYEDLDDEEKQQKEQNVKQLVKEAIQEEEAEKKKQELQLQAYQNNQYIIFHSVLFVASAYSCMLVTNWASPNFSSSQWNWSQYQASDASYWCKIICSWVTCVLYIWTLIAPAIFPDRDFS